MCIRDSHGFCTIPVAFGNGTSGFTIKNETAGYFTGSCTPITGGWAADAGARLAGDFDGDGKTDIALTGVPNSGWHTIPVAFSNGNGTFTVTNREVGGPAPDYHETTPLWPGTGAPYSQFALWATTMDSNNAPISKLVGDFNGDGRSDIALVGGAGWYTIPVAFSSGPHGDGSFRITNRCAAALGDPSCEPTTPIHFAALASWIPTSRRLVGDFNGDGRSDIALLNASNPNTPIAIAFSNGDGSFRITQRSTGMPNFSSWIGAGSPVVGDFDHDGSADIALVGVSGWTILPVALSNGDGTFRVVDSSGAANLAAFQNAAASGGSCGGVSYSATKLLGN